MEFSILGGGEGMVYLISIKIFVFKKIGKITRKLKFLFFHYWGVRADFPDVALMFKVLAKFGDYKQNKDNNFFNIETFPYVF